MSFRKERTGVMLAHPVNNKKLSAFPDTFLVQPKLRGQRCRTYWLDNEPYLLSSYANEFKYMEHVREILAKLPPWQYDGELYNHEWSQQQINSVCNRTTNEHPDSGKVTYVIYDIIPESDEQDITQMERALRLLKLVSDVRLLGEHVKICPTYRADKDDWKGHYENFIQDGFEGIILRDPRAPYILKRSPSLLKYKPTTKSQCKIVGFKEGEGWAENMLGSFLVEHPESKAQFYVGTGPAFTKEKRSFYWRNPDSYVGKFLEVVHEPMNAATDEGIPICTRGKKVF